MSVIDSTSTFPTDPAFAVAWAKAEQDARRPVYPEDPRNDALRERLLVDEAMGTPVRAPFDELTPEAKGVLAALYLPFRFPGYGDNAPGWAAIDESQFGETSASGEREILWSSKEIYARPVSAYIVRTDAYSPTDGAVTVGPVVVQFAVGNNDLVNLASVDELRDVASAMLEAAAVVEAQLKASETAK